MHEIGTLCKALEEIERVAKENNVTRLKAITLQVGEASGYLTHFFTEYFPVATEGNPLFEGCELKLLVTKAEAICLECHSMYNVMAQKGKCPKCGSREKEMISGQEFLIRDIQYAPDVQKARS